MVENNKYNEAQKYLKPLNYVVYSNLRIEGRVEEKVNKNRESKSD